MVDNHLTIPVSTTDDDADLLPLPLKLPSTTNPFHSTPNPNMDTRVTPAPSPSVIVPIQDTSPEGGEIEMVAAKRSFAGGAAERSRLVGNGYQGADAQLQSNPQLAGAADALVRPCTER